MDFSDIRTIIIGEAGEYGKRLVRYLEIHLSSAVRVYHFTTAEGMVSFKEEAEIYLLDERFFKELSEEKQKFLKQKKLILLTWREEQCRKASAWPSPMASPGATASARTMPLCSALTSNSIFIASSTAMRWPVATASPSATSRLTSTPALGALRAKVPGGASTVALAFCSAASAAK